MSGFLEQESSLTLVPDVHCYKCDITDFPNLIDLCGTIRDTHGNPSVLINNAGIGKYIIRASVSGNLLTSSLSLFPGEADSPNRPRQRTKTDRPPFYV